MKRLFLYIRFKGTNYCGWQIQPHAPSVQGTIENALQLILRVPTPIVGAGRTDSGVHAHLMVAHMDWPFQERPDYYKLISRLNSVLPPDICIIDIRDVELTAHARFSALERTYRYYVTTVKNPFLTDYALQLYNNPNFASMNHAAQALLTTEDFTSFSKLHTDTKTNICHVSLANWSQYKPGVWVFTITSDRFLRNMVRAIVGTLLAVGRGKITHDDFLEIMEKRDRCAAGDSAPAHGLFLQNVSYPQSLFLNNKKKS